MIYDLPTELNICGATYAIRHDYRAILDICIALSDRELTDEEKTIAALTIFYPDLDDMPWDHYPEALQKCYDFIERGEKHSDSGPKLMDWEHDFQYIVAPINKAIGTEVRALPYLHWWTFLSAYMEIGDCTFAQIVSIRDKKARHKQLEKWEKDWYKRNRDIVDIDTRYTEAEQNLLSSWGGA